MWWWISALVASAVLFTSGGLILGAALTVSKLRERGLDPDWTS